ncbi:unnamed protein product (macronuclear) [Paramecium tetraurelia]|uniref:Protein kinase domain-containing protein n=1 Tax=Paramecium tetraurelia TaxID=5888 RepID=A0BPQ2_PARTE|nr:uncharacterized protein GSPATT00005269001 [Paramecium tetraurelia]CAK60519.1 unnamed protein product [Paramecium tetraurelia]|eukprot:XP_001427917.1 hypothetical protein (macronuclear) [Paramecium tetraurelia strain d4-2]
MTFPMNFIMQIFKWIKILTIIQREKFHNCIQIHTVEYHQDIEKIFVLEEYNQQGNLHDFLKNNQNFTNNQIINCLLDIIKGLQQLSQHQYMHRDIKPQNIVFDGTKFKLIDFETCKYYGQDFSKLQSRIGTFICRAPEVQLDFAYSSKCDVWSIGCLLYYILYKSFPLQNYDPLQLLLLYQNNHQLKFPSQIINKELNGLLQQMLKIREIDRISLNTLYFLLKIIKCLIKFNINNPEENLASLIERIQLIMCSETNQEICKKIYICFKTLLIYQINTENQNDQQREKLKRATQEIIREFENEQIFLDLMRQINQQIQV